MLCAGRMSRRIRTTDPFSQLANTIALTLGSSQYSVWIASSIAIGTAVLSPIFSQAADYWGRRWFLVISTLLGGVGSIVVARATSMPMAVAGFTITALSYGAQPLLHAVSSEVLPRKYRSYGQAADCISNALGGIVGMLVGGAFVRTSNVPTEGFRNFWYVATGLYVFAAALCFALYNPPATERETAFSFGEKLKKLDWVGYFLLTSGIVLFCIGLSWSENPFPWSDPHTSATFAVGTFLLLALVAYETFVKKDGFLHHGLFQNRNFPIALACLFCEGLAFFGANSYFAFQAGVLYESDSVLVGARYSIASIVSIPASLLGGLYLALTKQVRWLAVSSFLSFVIFFALMANTDPASNTATWGYPVFLGAGLGLSLVSLITLAQLSTPPELIAITSGLVIGVRSLGGSVGLAIYNALFNSAMGKLGDNIAGAVIPMGLPPNMTGPFIGLLMAHDNAALAQLPGVTPPIIGAGVGAMLATFSKAFSHVWIAAACFVAVAALSTFLPLTSFSPVLLLTKYAVAVLIKDVSKEFNNHIDNPVEKAEELYQAKGAESKA